MIAINVIKEKMEIDNTSDKEFITRLQLATIMSTLSPRDYTKRMKFKVDENRMMLEFLMEQNNLLSSKVEMLERENASLKSRVDALEKAMTTIQGLFVDMAESSKRDKAEEDELLKQLLGC